MTNDTEPQYTLAEAQQLLALRECADYGHSFNVEYAVERAPTWYDKHTRQSKEPARFFCDRCGKSWTVVATEPPA
jgi:hypothetical protein